MGKEPDIAEFISALAAGNNAQLMVMACAGIAGSTALALVAAAQQTGGRLVCILPTPNVLEASKNALRPYSNCVEFVVGEAKTLLLDSNKGADFVLIDCDIHEPKGVFLAAQNGAEPDRALIVGYNALRRGSWQSDELKTHFLPIGEGLLVTRTTSTTSTNSAFANKLCGTGNNRSRWVVEVDKCTGEEHVFIIRDPHRKWIEA